MAKPHDACMQILPEYTEGAWSACGPSAAQVADIGAIVLMFPGAIAAMAAGALFGMLRGCLLIYVGTCVGQTLAFVLGRCVRPQARLPHAHHLCRPK